jgi:hypothetical protein
MRAIKAAIEPDYRPVIWNSLEVCTCPEHVNLQMNEDTGEDIEMVFKHFMKTHQ